MNLELNKNKGYVSRDNKEGYVGFANIDGCVIKINCAFFMTTKPNYIYLQRCSKLKYDDKNKTFIEYNPYPTFQAKLNATKRGDSVSFRGEFMFVSFRYSICAFWEDKDKKLLKFDIERCEKQPLLERINELLIIKKIRL